VVLIIQGAKLDKKLENFKVLKVEVKSFLLDHSFHTVNEFLISIKVDKIATDKSGNKFLSVGLQ